MTGALGRPSGLGFVSLLAGRLMLRWVRCLVATAFGGWRPCCGGRSGYCRLLVCRPWLTFAGVAVGSCVGGCSGCRGPGVPPVDWGSFLWVQAGVGVVAAAGGLALGAVLDRVLALGGAVGLLCRGRLWFPLVGDGCVGRAWCALACFLGCWCFGCQSSCVLRVCSPPSL